MLKTSGYTYKQVKKIPPRRMTLDSIMQRFEYSLKITSILAHDPKTRFIFIDETSLQSSLTKKRTWSMRNLPLVCQAPLRSQNFSMITAVDQYSVLGWMIVKGAANSQIFAYFIS